MNTLSKISIFTFILFFQITVFYPIANANTTCGKAVILMKEIKKRFGASNGELYYAMARGANRKSAFWKSCGYARHAKSASTAKKIALKHCRKHSDSCKITAQFRWTQKKCPTKRCYVWVPR
ncbi:MAG: hypothetical protein V3V02_02330 [Rhizobiaceae bacterium]